MRQKIIFFLLCSLTFSTSNIFAYSDPASGVYDNDEDFHKALRGKERKPFSETHQIPREQIEKNSRETYQLLKEYLIDQLTEDAETSPAYDKYKLTDQEKSRLNR